MSLYIDIAMGGVPQDIQSVKARHAAELMERPGVVSVGIGMGSGGQPAIIIGIERDDPSIKNTLPMEIEGHPVEIQVIGSIQAQ
jgi:hypothetical protein